MPWCVAEIAEAKRLQMDQSLKLLSKATLQERARTLENLDVRDMRASSEKDKELILGKIEDVDDFNAKLQVLIFDPKSGLVATRNAMDSLQQIGEVGRLIRWGLADAGSGKVWKAWTATTESTYISTAHQRYVHPATQKRHQNSDWIKLNRCMMMHACRALSSTGP